MHLDVNHSMNSFEGDNLRAAQQESNHEEAPSSEPAETRRSDSEDSSHESKAFYEQRASYRIVRMSEPPEETAFHETGDLQSWLANSDELDRSLTDAELRSLASIDSLEPTGDIVADTFAYHCLARPGFENDPIGVSLACGSELRALGSLRGTLEVLEKLVSESASNDRFAYYNRVRVFGKRPGELRPSDEPYYQALIRSQLEAVRRLRTIYDVPDGESAEREAA